MAITIYDVAHEAGVSAATVSRVFSPGSRVAPDLAARVRAAATRLRYTPSRVARSLRTQDSLLLALIIPDIENPFFTSVARGVEDAAREFGLSVVLFNTDEDLVREHTQIAVAAAERMAGVILSPVAEHGSDVGPLLLHDQPVVAIDRLLRTAPIDSVTVNNIRGADEATTHLLSQGYRRVACISAPRITPGRDRLRGYRRALRRRGIAPESDLVADGDFKEEGGYEAARSLFRLRDPPDALFVANNRMGIGAMQCLADLRIRIGPELGLVAFDEAPWARLVNPPLTTVAQPTYQIGQRAVELLTQRAAHPGARPASVVLRAELKVRASSLRQPGLASAEALA